MVQWQELSHACAGLGHSFGVASTPMRELSEGKVMVPAGPGAAAAESEEKSNPFLSASNFKGKGVHLVQKADLAHFTDAKTEVWQT